MVVLAIAAMGLNLCIGYTGLVSFGHSTWFGIGAYAAGLIQLHWFRGEIWLPLLLSMIVVALASDARRHHHPAPARGLFLAADAGARRAYLHHRLPLEQPDRRRRWPRRPEARHIGPFNLDDTLNYYIVVAVLCLGVLYLLLRLVRSPFGHVLMAIRENQLARHLPGLSGRALQARSSS